MFYFNVKELYSPFLRTDSCAKYIRMQFFGSFFNVHVYQTNR